MIAPLTLGSSGAAAAEAATTNQTAAKPPTPRPEVLRAARDFEAIFLRTLLKPLENSTRLSSSNASMPGQSAYGSMVVGALSDSLATSGGLGLADVIARAMAVANPESAATPQIESSSAVAPGTQASQSQPSGQK